MAAESLTYREVDNKTITEEDRLTFYYQRTSAVFRKTVMDLAKSAYLATKDLNRQKASSPKSE